MANQLFAGFLYDDAGAAIVGATVNLYARNTVTPVLATTTTDANGYWTISYATEGRYDVELVSGSSKRRRKYDDSVQLETIEAAVLRVRNPADTFDYDIVPAAIVADRQLNLPLITGTDTLAALGLAQTITKQLTLSVASATPQIIDRLTDQGTLFDLRQAGNGKIAWISAAASPQVTTSVQNALDHLMVSSVQGANTTAGGAQTVRGGVGGTSGGIGGPVKIEGGAAGGGDVAGGRVQLTPGAKAGTGLKPLVEIDGSGDVPTTAVLAAGYAAIRYVSAGAATLYVNDGGTIKSLSLGTPA